MGQRRQRIVVFQNWEILVSHFLETEKCRKVTLIRQSHFIIFRSLKMILCSSCDGVAVPIVWAYSRPLWEFKPKSRRIIRPPKIMILQSQKVGRSVTVQRYDPPKFLAPTICDTASLIPPQFSRLSPPNSRLLAVFYSEKVLLKSFHIQCGYNFFFLVCFSRTSSSFS